MIKVQLKATDNPIYLKDGKTIALRIESADVLSWRGSLMPVVLVLYDARSGHEAAYWIHIQDYFKSQEFNLESTGETITVHFSIEDRLDKEAIRTFALGKNEIYAVLWSYWRNMDNKVTLSHLDKALLHLGFEKEEYNHAHWLYIRKPEKALIVLPITTLDALVPLAELVTAKTTVVDMGIATSEAFEALLEEERRQSNLEPLRIMRAQVVALEAEAREWQRHGEELNARVRELENRLDEQTRQLSGIRA